MRFSNGMMLIKCHATHLATRMSDRVVLSTLKLCATRDTTGSSTCTPRGVRGRGGREGRGRDGREKGEREGGKVQEGLCE